MDKKFLLEIYSGILYQIKNIENNNIKGCEAALVQYKERLKEVKYQIRHSKDEVYNVVNLVVYNMESLDSTTNIKYGISDKGRKAFRKIIGLTADYNI